MRVLCHAQHLTGVGHYVIAHNIARGLAEAHEVHLVHGGRAVPRPTARVEPRRISLPMLERSSDGRLVADGGGSADAALLRRAELLADAARAIRPDVVLVDHFPFSKWELGPEITATIEAAREVNPRVRVLCSLRDIAPRTRYEATSDEEHARRVVELLGEWFDGLLVHADPAFVRLEEHFAGHRDVPVPLTYTGFVCETPPPAPAVGSPWAVLSGGGVDSAGFLTAAVHAFCRVAGSGASERMRLQVFSGLAPRASDRVPLEAAIRRGPVDLHPFSASFGAWLGGAVLSISRAGYNTCTALMRARVRAVVVPGPLSDQGLRARRLAAAGLAVMVDPERECDVTALAAAIERTLAEPVPHHTFDLDGVAATRRLVEALGEERR